MATSTPSDSSSIPVSMTRVSVSLNRTAPRTVMQNALRWSSIPFLASSMDMSGKMAASSSSPMSERSSVSSSPSPRSTSMGWSRGRHRHRSSPSASLNRRRSMHSSVRLVSGSVTVTSCIAGGISFEYSPAAATICAKRRRLSPGRVNPRAGGLTARGFAPTKRGDTARAFRAGARIAASILSTIGSRPRRVASSVVRGNYPKGK